MPTEHLQRLPPFGRRLGDLQGHQKPPVQATDGARARARGSEKTMLLLSPRAQPSVLAPTAARV